MRPANERRRYNVTSRLIGWVHVQNDPCNTTPAQHNEQLQWENCARIWVPKRQYFSSEAMAWRTSNKSLPKAMMTQFSDPCVRHYDTMGYQLCRNTLTSYLNTHNRTGDFKRRNTFSFLDQCTAPNSKLDAFLVNDSSWGANVPLYTTYTAIENVMDTTPIVEW